MAVDKEAIGTFLFHYICFVVHLIGVTYNMTAMDLEAYNMYGGRFKYLTFLNLLVQLLYFNASAVVDLYAITRKRKNEVFWFLCDRFFACFAFPLGVTVALLFWGLFLADPHSCRTKEEAELIPVWFNHYAHTFPAVSVLLELFLLKHEYPSRSVGLQAILGFSGLYTMWVLWIASVSDFWVYPILQGMSLPVMTCFFAVAYALIAGIYIFGERVSMWKWCTAVSPSKKQT